jgi:quercetin dioxygenase-like cupin family protein
MIMMINIKKIGQDARGKIFILEDDGKEFAHLMIIKAGMSRGGHFHDMQEVVTVLDGKIGFSKISSNGKGKESLNWLSTGDQIVVEPGMAHIMTAKEDSLVLGNIGPCKTEAYAPYRNVVERTK